MLCRVGAGWPGLGFACGYAAARRPGHDEQNFASSPHSPIPFMYTNGVSNVHLPEIIAAASRN
jgi:hypothetical protein